jgi:hypothetical protein
MTAPNALDMLEFGEALIDQCEVVVQRYDDWNAEIRDFHSHNSHLYYRELKIREPPPLERRRNARSARNPRNYQRPVDPVPTAMEQVGFMLQHDSSILPHPETARFQQMHTIPYYRDQRITARPDPNLPVNQIRLHGPDDASAHVNEIPNASSKVSATDPRPARHSRELRMRTIAFQTAHSARGDRPLKVPAEILRSGYKKPPQAIPPPQLKVFRDHRETRKKIAKLEKAFEESMASSARHIRRINAYCLAKQDQGD